MRLVMPLRVLLALGTVTALQQAAAWACSCLAVTDVVAAADDYDEVFVGEVRGTGGGGCDSRTVTRFEVVEAFKGVDDGDRVAVEHSVQGSACGLTYDKGELYLVFARGGETGLCDPGGLAGDASREIDELREALVE